MQIFRDIFSSSPQIKNLKKTIVEECMKKTPYWFEGQCSEHKKNFVNFLIVVLLRKHCTWALENERKKSEKRKSNNIEDKENVENLSENREKKKRNKL